MGTSVAKKKSKRTQSRRTGNATLRCPTCGAQTLVWVTFRIGDGDVVRERVCKLDKEHRFYSREAIIGSADAFVRVYDERRVVTAIQPVTPSPPGDGGVSVAHGD